MKLWSFLAFLLIQSLVQHCHGSDDYIDSDEAIARALQEAGSPARSSFNYDHPGQSEFDIHSDEVIARLLQESSSPGRSHMESDEALARRLSEMDISTSHGSTSDEFTSHGFTSRGFDSPPHQASHDFDHHHISPLPSFPSSGSHGSFHTPSPYTPSPYTPSSNTRSLHTPSPYTPSPHTPSPSQARSVPSASAAPRREEQPRAPPQQPPSEGSTLTVLKLKAKDLKKPENKCTICLEQFTINTKVVAGPCLHRFCDDCIKEWLSTHGNCPICKVDIR